MKKISTEQLIPVVHSDPRLPTIQKLREKGKTLSFIGNKYGVTRERIRQILLPIKPINIYVYQCEKCNFIIKNKRRIITRCFNCSPSKRLNLKGDLSEKDFLNKIFKDLPSWKREGRERTRTVVRYRDNHTCQDCGKKWKKGNRAFDVHHLGGFCGLKTRAYDKLEDLPNLVTLCHKCHYNRPEHGMANKLKRLSTRRTVQNKS